MEAEGGHGSAGSETPAKCLPESGLGVRLLRRKLVAVKIMKDDDSCCPGIQHTISPEGESQLDPVSGRGSLPPKPKISSRPRAAHQASADELITETLGLYHLVVFFVFFSLFAWIYLEFCIGVYIGTVGWDLSRAGWFWNFKMSADTLPIWTVTRFVA